NTPAATREGQKPRRKKAGDQPADAWQRAKPDKLQEHLRELEKRFQELAAPLDALERQDLWREMGQMNALLGVGNDATLCMANALGEGEDPPALWLEEWVQVETRGTNNGLTGSALDRLLTSTDPQPAEIRSLAAYLAWTAHTSR